MTLYRMDEYSIGTSYNILAPLRLMNVATPDQVVWRDAAIFYLRGDMSRVGDGLPSFDWIWDVMTIARISNLVSLISGAESGYVYVRTNRRVGIEPNVESEFHMYRALMYKPILSGEEGVSIARAEHSLQTVKVTFVNAVNQDVYGYL